MLGRVPNLSGGGTHSDAAQSESESLIDDAISDTADDEHLAVAAARASRTSAKAAEANDFLLARQAVIRFVQDSIADAIDRQKQNADRYGRTNTLSFKQGDLVLLSTTNLPAHAVTNVGSSKLLPKYIGPFRVLDCRGSSYTLELPPRMRTHPTFYVGRLRPYYQYESVRGELSRDDQARSTDPEDPSSAETNSV